MGQLKHSEMNYTILFVAFCHAVIFIVAFLGEESVQNLKAQLKNKQLTGLFCA